MRVDDSQKRRGGDREQNQHSVSTQNDSIRDEQTPHQQSSMEYRNGNKNAKTDYRGKREAGRSDRPNGDRNATAQRNERSTVRRDQSVKRQASPDFHQILKTVKGRMDMTFRNLENGLHQVERNINEELANVLAQVMDFEEGMKPQLLRPYKKCKEFESLLAPALARMPKRSASEHNGSRRQPPDDKYDQRHTKMSPEERYRDLMTNWRDKNKSRDAVRSGSRENCNPGDRGRRSGDPLAERRERHCPSKRFTKCDNSTPDNSIENDDGIGRTMQELQDISVSVNNSLKRINRAFNRTQELKEERPCPVGPTISRPEMLARVNDSLYQIGTGAKLLKKLLVEERTKSNC